MQDTASRTSIPAFARSFVGSVENFPSRVMTFSSTLVQLDDDTCFPSLTVRQRYMCAGACFSIGVLLQLASLSSLGVHIAHFALSYTLGNIVALSSSVFVCGPRAQLNKLKSEQRAETALVFAISAILTLCLIFFTSFPRKSKGMWLGSMKTTEVPTVGGTVGLYMPLERNSRREGLSGSDRWAESHRCPSILPKGGFELV